MTELWERDAWELADDVRAGKLKAVDLLDHFLARVETLQRRAERVLLPRRRRAPRSDAAEIDAAVARGEDPGLWAGVPMGVKELVAVEGWPDTHASMLYKDDIAEHTATEAGAAARGRRGARRAHDVTRVRFGQLDAHVYPRRDAQPVEPRAHARRFVGRLRGRGRGRHDADLHRERRRRVDPHPVRVQRAVRLQGQLRPGRRQRTLRLRAHVGARSDVPVGARRRSLRRRDRRSDRRRPHVVAEAAVVRRRAALGRARRSGCADCAPRGRRRSASRCATRRSRSARTKPRSRSWPTPASSSSTSTSTSRARAGRGASCRTSTSPPTTCEACRRRATKTSRRCRGPASRRSQRMTERPDARARSSAAGSCSRAIADVFDEVDLILTPTTATTAFKAEGPPPMEIAGQRVGGMGSVPYTAPFNISGMPAVSIPVGTSVDGLPGRLAGRRPPPRRRARPRAAARSPSRTAPGPSSPRWRT